MTLHELKPPVRRPLVDAPETGHNRWHPDIAPVVTCEPGDEVLLETRDAFDGQFHPGATAVDVGSVTFTINGAVAATRAPEHLS